MKKIILILSLILVLVFTSTTAFAETTDEIAITVDSFQVEFSEETGFPFVDENSRSLVPFRKTLETYGATVDWNNDNRVAIAIKNDITVEVPIDENYIIVNGVQQNIDSAAKIVNERTYLPIRSVIEAFGSSVEWDSSNNTVVITTIPVDAKEMYILANDKSYEWKNYDANINMFVTVPYKDENGNLQKTDLRMDMYMTIFMEPSLKIKLNSNMSTYIQDQKFTQPLMEMYMTANENEFATYVGALNETGSLAWSKSVVEDDLFMDLLKYDDETIKKNKELTEKYTKDVKYLGQYVRNENQILSKLQYTMSGEIYNEMFSEYINQLSNSSNEQDIMALEMFKGFAEGNFGDLTYYVFIDEATDEIVSYEIDLASVVLSMLSSMPEFTEGITPEDLELLKGMKAYMFMDVLNINNSLDFEIPEEVLNAPVLEIEAIEETEEIEEPQA